MKTKKKQSANSARFAAGSAGICEAELWKFTGPLKKTDVDGVPEVNWIAAVSLDEALQYLRQRYSDFVIMEVTRVSMIAVVSGSPLD